MIRAKLPSAVVHIHGALFVTWIFLLVAQSSLIPFHKVKLHMTLGILGFILPPMMVVAGILTLFGAVRRGIADIPPEFLLAGDLENLVIFIILIAWGLLARRNGAFHKRLMILGTMAITGPAIDRWGFGLNFTIGVILALPLPVVVYDLLFAPRVHRTTIVACAMIFTAMLTLFPASRLGFCQHLITWIRHT